MRIAVLSPITWRTPPRNYGPWEQVVSVLAEGLMQEGIDVTLFATGDAVTKAKLEWVWEKPLGECPADAKVAECMHISHLMEMASDFDVIHNHFDFLPLTYSRLVNTPVITTIHGFSSKEIIPVFKKYNARSHYVSISNSDRHSELTYLDTVYNGLDERQFNFGKGNGDYLLYFGRIDPRKGACEAIQIAAQSNKKLVLCGLIQDRKYFEESVAPCLNNDTVVYMGNVSLAQRDALMGDALALLHPISFEEPFGLSVAEAMMCGTPVIAFKKGATRELIIDGKTGFLVNTVGEAVEAVNKVSRLCRCECRTHALEKFSSKAMASNYINLYRQIIKKRDSL